MKACPDALKSHLAGETTSLATLWRVARADGTVLGFTDHDRDIVFEGLAYRAATGFSRSSIANAADMAVDDLEIESVLDAAEIDEADLLDGRYDGATIEVMLVNHADPGMGALALRRGSLGEVRLTDHGFVAELRGMTAAFARAIGQIYGPTCRADLGDERCGLDRGSWTVAATASAVGDRSSFTATGLTQATGWFDHGILTWTGGANLGLAMEVKSFAAGGAITLFLPMRHDIAAGDTFSLHAGCDRRFETCTGKFANAVNFRGEPHVPGMDFILAAASR